MNTSHPDPPQINDAVTTRSPPGGSIIGLDLIRFAAASFVMLFHLSYYSWAEPQSPSGKILSHVVDYRYMAALSSWGWVGVHIFFVISGYVIALSAHGKSAGQFFRGRFLRLYPAVWICSLLTLVALLAIGPPSNIISLYLKSIILFPIQPWVDAVYWTLGVEMSFYFMVFVLIWFNSFNSLSVLLSVIGIVSTMMWIVWLSGLSELGMLRHTRWAELLLFPYGCYFALGGLIWLILSDRPTVARTIIAAACFLGGAIGVYSLSQKSIYGSYVPVIIWAIAVLAIMLSVVFNGAITALFKNSGRWVRLIGLATYPIYLVHDVVGAAIIYWLCYMGMHPLPALLLSIFIVICLALFIASVIEPMVRRGTSRLLPFSRA